MPNYLSKSLVEGERPDEPFARRMIMKRRIALASLIVTIVSVLPFLPEVAALLHNLGQAIVAGAKEQAARLLIEAPSLFLPYRRIPALFDECPDIVSYLNRELTEDERILHGARPIGRAKGKLAAFGYIFKRPTYATLTVIDELEGTMNSSGTSGAISARAGFMYFAIGKWGTAFLRSYRGVRLNSSGSFCVPTVSRSAPATITCSRGLSLPPGAAEDDELVREVDAAAPFSIQDDDEYFTPNSEEYVISPRAVETITAPDAIPRGVNFIATFPYISAMFIADSTYLNGFYSRYVSGHCRVDEQTPEDFEARKKALSDIASLEAGQVLGHFCFGAELAMRNSLDIFPVFSSGQYGGFVLGSSVKFDITIQGLSSSAIARDLGLQEMDFLFDNLRVAEELARLLNGIERTNPDLPRLWNRPHLTAKELLSGSAAPLLAIHNRLGNISEDERRQIRALVMRLNYRTPRYLPVDPPHVIKAITRIYTGSPWTADDEDVTDLAINEDDIFEEDPTILVMKAFGELGFSFRSPGGVKFSLRGTDWNAFYTSTKVVGNGKTRAGERLTKNVPRNSVLRVTRLPYRQAAESMATFLATGEVNILVSDKAPLPAGTIEIANREDIRKIWGALHEAALSRVEEGRRGGDLSGVRERGPPPTEAERPARRRRLVESDDEMDE